MRYSVDVRPNDRAQPRRAGEACDGTRAWAPRWPKRSASAAARGWAALFKFFKTMGGNAYFVSLVSRWIEMYTSASGHTAHMLRVSTIAVHPTNALHTPGHWGNVSPQADVANPIRGDNAMSVEENKNIARRYHDLKPEDVATILTP